jgi:phenylacetate-CoA ligase
MTDSQPKPDPRYPEGGPLARGLGRVLERARRSPFFRRKLAAAGLADRDPEGWDAWLAVPPTTKDELRELAAFEAEVSIASRREVAEFWRSGGVTGRPLFYPRTHQDVDESLTAFARSLRLAGVGPEDTFMCALPIGIHPAGQQMVRAAERLGAAAVWAGAGNQTPSAAQTELVHELGVTVWCGMASFGLQLAHLAEGGGRPLQKSAIRLVITTAEMLSAPKRALLAELWGARVVDLFGMSELTLMAGECGRRPGLHVWPEHSFCEVLHPDTLAPVPAGEVGVLCATPVTGNAATPFLRWLSGDIVRMEFGCDCAEASSPRLVHAGRTTGFFKLRGINVNHTELEERLYQVPSLRDFRVTLTPDDRLLVEVEAAEEAAPAVVAATAVMIRDRFELRAEVVPVERGTIAKAVEGQIKAQRFVDQRGA